MKRLVFLLGVLSVFSHPVLAQQKSGSAAEIQGLLCDTLGELGKAALFAKSQNVPIEQVLATAEMKIMQEVVEGIYEDDAITTDESAYLYGQTVCSEAISSGRSLR